MKRPKLAFVVLAALVALSLVALPSSEAASTVSNTTYLVNGREIPVGFDPISLKSGMLLPEVLMDQISVTVNQSGTGAFTATRGLVTVKMQVGSKVARLDGVSRILASAPIRLTGQLYIPAEAMTLLGVQVSIEGGYLFLDAWPPVQGTPDTAKYTEARRASAQERVITPVRDTTIRVEVVRLNDAIVMGQPWTADPFARGRTLELLQSGNLIQITITNSSNKVLNFTPSSYFLVDNLGNQYPLSDDRIPLMGDLFGNIAPGAIVSGVLVYPGLAQDVRMLNLYLQTQTQMETLATYTF